MSSSSRPCPRPLLVQSLSFERRHFEPFDVYAWLEDAGYPLVDLRETPSRYHATIRPRSAFLPNSFSLGSFGKGNDTVHAVFGCPRSDSLAILRAQRQR